MANKISSSSSSSSYRPQRDGRLNRPWGEVTPAEIQTCNLPIANPALYHTATSAPVFRLQSNAVLISRKVPIHPSFEAWKSPAERWSTSHFLNSTSRRKLLCRKVPGQIRLPFYVYLNHQLTTTTTTVRFNDHFARGPGLADTRMSPFLILLELRVMEVVVYNWSYKKCKAAVKMPPPTPISFTGRIPFLSPNQLPPSEYK